MNAGHELEAGGGLSMISCTGAWVSSECAAIQDLPASGGGTGHFGEMPTWRQRVWCSGYQMRSRSDLAELPSVRWLSAQINAPRGLGPDLTILPRTGAGATYPKSGSGILRASRGPARIALLASLLNRKNYDVGVGRSILLRCGRSRKRSARGTHNKFGIQVSRTRCLRGFRNRGSPPVEINRAPA